jgi:ferrous iron transport protein A
MLLKDVEIGTTCKVLGYDTASKAYRVKMYQMGLHRGVEFVLVRKAPFGCPIVLRVYGNDIVLRADESDAMEIEVL